METSKIKTRHMMATKAYHQLGDISNDTYDICLVYDEDGDNYIGNWITGMGFIDVKFPKDTTRELTPEEIEYYHGLPTMLGDAYFFINIKGEDFTKNACLYKNSNGNNELVFRGTLMCPIKIGSILYFIGNNGGTYSTSRIKKVEGNVVHTKNSIYTLEYV